MAWQNAATAELARRYMREWLCTMETSALRPRSRMRWSRGSAKVTGCITIRKANPSPLGGWGPLLRDTSAALI